MTLLKNWKYHLYTFCFFLSIIFFFLTFKKLIFIEIYGTTYQKYYLFELFFCATLLYFISIISLLVLEKTETLGLLKVKNIALVIASISALHILYQYILWPLLAEAQNYFLEKQDYFYFTPQQTFDKRLVNYFFFFFMSINWLVFIYAYKIYQINQKDLKQKLNIEKNLKEANLNTLKGQINPHFIFNSLNNIRGLVQEDPSKSKVMITRLSELLRSSLLSGKSNTLTLDEELETVENFLELSKIQYEDRLQYSFDISPDTRSLQVPPMILQMLVENAVKHGISMLKNGGLIHIKAYKDEQNILLMVKNTGQISQQKNTTKIGIKNIEERLKLLYNHQATFSLKENNDEVIALISIPYQYF